VQRKGGKEGGCDNKRKGEVVMRKRVGMEGEKARNNKAMQCKENRQTIVLVI